VSQRTWRRALSPWSLNHVSVASGGTSCPSRPRLGAWKE
jgi:hypothetical protein